MTFADDSAHRLPGTVTLPAAFRRLFEWIEFNGWVEPSQRGAGAMGLLHPADSRRGSYVWFRVDTSDENRKYLESWFGTDITTVQDRLVPFAGTGADGSRAAFWIDNQGQQRIVHLGSGSGSMLTCVLADDPVDFLRLLAIGYDDITEPALYVQPPQPDPGHPHLPNLPFSRWVTDTFNVTIPECGLDLVPTPVEMTDPPGLDAFCDWVNARTPW